MESSMAGDASALRRSQITSSYAWQACFHHDFFKNYLQDLEIVQMDAPHDFSQSALNHGLN
jgi:hypothetical protein